MTQLQNDIRADSDKPSAEQVASAASNGAAEWLTRPLLALLTIGLKNPPSKDDGSKSSLDQSKLQTSKLESNPAIELQPKLGFSWPLVIGIFGLAILFGGLGGWAAVTEISGAVVSSGSVNVKGKPKTVQHLDGGIVAEIRVANGDVVSAGDTLLKLDDKLLAANLRIYKNRLAEALARRARLIAERNGDHRITWPTQSEAPLGVLPDQQVRLSQQKLLDVRRSSLKGQLAQLKEKIEQYRHQITGTEGLKTSKLEQISFIERELKGLKQLFEKGNSTLNRLLALERQRAELVGQTSEHNSQIARIANLINETKINMLQAEREASEKVLSELRDSESEVNDLLQEYYKTKEKLNRVEIKAPIGGMIHELAIFTVGGVVAPGDVIMQIVPTDEDFEIVLNVEPQFIDDISIGQPATLHFSAFNQRNTPNVTGAVRSVSPSIVTDEKTGASFYTIQVDVSDAELLKVGGRTRLVPGMPVEAFVQKHDRTVLDYITRPLTDQIRRAFREE